MAMEDEQQKIKDNFEQNLKAKDYFKGMAKAWDEEPEVLRFMLLFINDVVRSGKFNGTKLLEIGCGATVHNIASASLFFPNITMSDYVTDNLENLKKWVDGDSTLEQLLDIPAGLAGFGNDIESGKRMLEDQIRKTIRRIVRCDVLSEEVILSTSDDPLTSPPYDMIISCLTMEVAPKDVKDYCKSLKNVSKLLRTGGGLLMCGFLHGSKWGLGVGKEFHHIDIGEKDLLFALSEAGFGNIQLETRKGSGLIRSGDDFTYDKFYCLAAEKL